MASHFARRRQLTRPLSARTGAAVGQDKKPAPAAKKKEDARPQPDLGVAVDSARKSDALATWNTTENNQGELTGPWVIKQSVEFGGRITNFTGNQGTWDTFVNLGSGPRLLEYTLDMHSPTHTGLLFDDLLFSNFGYGGDPNNVSRVRAQKGKIYSFNGSFRRDQNIFDYDLLTNPLNPPNSVPNVPILNSPHEFLMTRRMSDANLNLFPVGTVRFTLGWSRVVNDGSTFTTDHQGTDALLFQPTSNTTDSYHFGVSLRFIPRTNFNYDQFYTYFKGDTSANLPTVAQMNIFGIPGFTLAGGIPVNLGLPFNTSAGIPCATPVLGTGLANPTCNGFFSYSRFGKLRNSYPTEQFSFQSNYFKRVDFSGRLNYSDAESKDPSTAELFNGLGRNRLRTFGISGHGHGELGGGPNNAGNAGRGCALPVRPDDHVETGLRAVLQTKLGDLGRARVIHRERPEAVAEVRHLNDHRFPCERQPAQPVHDILVRDGDEGLGRTDVTGQHHDLIHWTDRHHAGEKTRFGSLGERRALVVHVDERPSPHVGHARHHLHVRLRHRPGHGTGHLRGGLRNRDLLRVKNARECENGSDRCGGNVETFHIDS